MMIYEPNTITWRKGDVFLEDMDAKEPWMLLCCVGYSRDKQYIKAQYICKFHKRRIIKFHVSHMPYLHAPERFGIRSEWGVSDQVCYEAQTEWLLMKRWNYYRDPCGEFVKTTSADGGFEAFAAGEAFMSSSGSAMIHLKPGGNWLLRFVVRTKWRVGGKAQYAGIPLETR